jgi:hypothetical protein
MSIINTLLVEIASGRLFEYQPAYVDPDFVKRRNLYMSEEAYQQCPPRGASSRADFRGQALHNSRAQLTDFVGGEAMEEDLDLKQLEPTEAEIWEIRVHHDAPQVRLFGWFVAPDHFAVTHCELRSSLNLKWDKEINKAKRKRIELFHQLPIHRGMTFTDYVAWRGVPKYAG